MSEIINLLFVNLRKSILNFDFTPPVVFSNKLHCNVKDCICMQR